MKNWLIAKFSGHVEAVNAAEGGEEVDLGRDEGQCRRVQQTDPGGRTFHLEQKSDRTQSLMPDFAI
jgi:hypothetical protein